ncbi:hypothetical protein KP773_08720 [Streptococcus equi subsp. zooepidemicus]|uniref:DUF6076 domain-containing protein n=1 Tax=Streptococcus equi TaxID=1336 RepID=UPI00198154AA|nr:DUF6076 domain-containing protein [Streptococcus equi]MCD3387069.1 hypothetical protein [Streptococcus equi subsp. zooepidemicus]MCD3417965.1 hypothetical protein [Streptococcus equi subsp. zooepidemicus]MCD3421841.1 hypothetical protein [Streptococcus equi subsp. zooepidemicus]MCD3435881.1 hypothetical protein [Streptococcus equi subsp. zooepidemicus]MCD3439581.1 hypothetical protein [Streptococcus equi subsp. zooepidemicus]
MFTLKDITSDFLQTAIYIEQDDKDKIIFEYLPNNQIDTLKKREVYSDDRFSLFLNIFNFDTTDNSILIDKIKALLFITTKYSEINEFDISEADFAITDDVGNFITKYLDNYKTIVNLYPITYMLYPYIFKILRYLLCKNNLYSGSYKVDLDSAIDSYVGLYNEIHYLIDNLDNMKQEVIDIFNTFSEYKVKLPTSEIALIYQAYNQKNKNELIFNDLNPFIRTNTDKIFSSWKDIVMTLPNKLDAPLEFPVCDSIIKFLRQTVQNLIHDEMSLRKCKNCDRYFIVRYSSLAEYCLRKVEGTNSTCQEYASKKTYKKKQAANPLYQVFTTYYNRIYGRIRRGTLDKDSTLLDDIKILHQEFATKYDELADKNEKEKLIQEFTSSAENLIK